MTPSRYSSLQAAAGSTPRPRTGVTLAFAGALLVIAISGLVALSEYTRRTREATGTLLESIAHGHQRAVLAHLAERRADARLIADEELTRALAAGRVAPGSLETAREELLGHLRRVAAAYKYHSVQVVDADLRPIAFTLHDETQTLEVRRALERTIATGTSTVTPIVRDPTGEMEYGLIVPIFLDDADRESSARPIGAVYAALLAKDRLLTDLATTLTVSGTIDATLLQVVRDSVWVFSARSALRGGPLYSPVARSDTAYGAAQSTRVSAEHSLTALDFRGVMVRAHSDPIPGTSWQVVSKIDLDEAEARIRAVRLMAAVVFLLLVSVSASIGRLLWVERQREYRELQLRVGDRALRVVQTSLDGFVELDDDGWILEANEATARITGYSPDELARMRLSDLKVFTPNDSLEQSLARIRAMDGAHYNSVWRRKDGTLVDLDVSARHLTESGLGRTFAFIRDITDTLRTNRQLERANRVYRVLNAANEALFKARSRDEAYTAAVQAIVDVGGFRLVSIGEVDHQQGVVTTLASAGEAVAFASAIRIPIGAVPGKSPTPIMEALERCERVAINDLATDPATANWHALAVEHHLGSMAVLPVRRRNSCVALVLVYSAVPDDFDDDSLAILGEVARFLGVVLQSQEAAETRRREEERFRELFESSPIAMFVVDEASRRLLRLNRAFTELFGYTLDETPTVEAMMQRLMPDERYREATFSRFVSDLALLSPERPSVTSDAIRVRCSAGRERVVQGSTSRVGGELMVAWTDLTELRRNQQLANEAQSIAKLISWEFDYATMRVRFADPLLQSEAEQDPDGQGLFSRVIPEDRARVMPLFLEASARGTPMDVVARFRAPDGALQYLRNRVRIEMGPDGKAVRAIGSSQDVTQETLLAQELESHRTNLEELVRARTEELARVNAQLMVNDRRLSAMLELSQRASSLDEPALLQLGIDEAVRLTGSEVGYLHLISDDQQRIEFNTWSSSTEDRCDAAYQNHFPVNKAGIWADAVRSKKAVVHNSVEATHLREGYPEGHVHLTRHLAVPLVEGGQVRLLMGIGNKPSEYDASDIQELELIARDVWSIVQRRRTESKLAEAYAEVAASDARFSFAMQASSEGIWDWDLANDVVTYSREYLKTLGYGPGEFSTSGATWGTHLHPDDRERTLTKLFNDLQKDVPSTVEFRIRRKDGEYIWGQTRGQVVSRDAQGKATRAVGTFSDLSAQRAAEEELRNAKEAADAANRAKSAFLAVMSHEIRTPLNGVIGMAEVLSQSPLPAREADAVRTIRSSGANLMTIIDDILDFSKIEAGRLELDSTDTDLHELLDGVLSTLGPVATAKGVELSVVISPQVPQRIMTDETRLRQILMNLVGNAIKFSGGRPAQMGNVQLRLALASTDPLHLRFSVRDNGIGISEGARARLFTSFQQAEASTTRRFGGTGLGLAICLRLAEAFGGSIEVESTVGEGSTFHVTIPTVPSAEQPVVKLPDVAGLNCVVVRCGQPMCYADDLAEYLRHSGATALVEDDEQWARRRAASLTGPVVLVDFAARGDYLGGTVAEDDSLRHLRITHGHRRAARVVSPQLVVLDHSAVRERSFLRAVAIAAGRASPEVFADSLEEPIVEPGTMPLSVAEARAAGRLILVAEDDEINQKVILRQLELLGHAAEVAANGVEALTMWRRNSYALLITDLHMPEMDGYELAAAIRRMEATGTRAPIIALTANALRGEALRTKEVGMDAYLTKPIRLKDLKHVLHDVMVSADGVSVTEPDTMAEGASVTQSVSATDDVVDVEVLKRYIGDDAEAITEFLAEFRKSVVQHAAELAKGVTGQDVAAVKHTAHTLKSTSRAAGATAFGDVLAELEAAASRHDLAAIDRYFQEFQRMLPLVMARLNVLVPPI